MDFINTSFNNILSLSSSFSTSLVSIFNSSFNSSQTLQKNKCPHIKSGISNCYRCNGKICVIMKHMLVIMVVLLNVLIVMVIEYVKE